MTLITIVRIKFSLDGAIEFSITLLLFAVSLIVLMAYSYYFANKSELSDIGAGIRF